MNTQFRGLPASIRAVRSGADRLSPGPRADPRQSRGASYGGVDPAVVNWRPPGSLAAAFAAASCAFSVCCAASMSSGGGGRCRWRVLVPSPPPSLARPGQTPAADRLPPSCRAVQHQAGECWSWNLLEAELGGNSDHHDCPMLPVLAVRRGGRSVMHAACRYQMTVDFSIVVGFRWWASRAGRHTLPSIGPGDDAGAGGADRTGTPKALPRDCLSCAGVPRLVSAVRAFFDARGYVEVETPCAVPAPGEEVHLAAFATERVRADRDAGSAVAAHQP